MKAMIFAAGLGTRLRPYTNDRPKALVEVGGMPLLEIAIRRLLYFGVSDIIVNVHHFADQIVDFLERKDHFGIHIAISDERGQLLDTGGGLKKAAWFFAGGAPFLLMNTDVLSDLDLNRLYQTHLDAGALATLAVRHRKTSRYLLFDEDDLLCGWRNVKTGEEKMSRAGVGGLTPLAFSGMQVISPALFDYFPADNVFSIIDVYLAAAHTRPICAFRHDDGRWLDVGKVPALTAAEQLLPEIELAPPEQSGRGV